MTDEASIDQDKPWNTLTHVYSLLCYVTRNRTFYKAYFFNLYTQDLVMWHAHL